MSIPAWIMAVLLAAQAVGAFSLDGQPREPYNGTVLFCEALLTFALLAWGGFFRPWL